MSKEKKDKVEKWLEQVNEGMTYLKDYGHAEDWELFRRYYRGDFPGFGRLQDTDILPMNITFKYARETIPRVYHRNPYVSVTPRVAASDPGNEMKAKVVEAVDNYLIEETGLKQEMKRGAMDCFFTDRAFWKIGFGSQFGSPSVQGFGGLDYLGSQESTDQQDKKGKPNEYHGYVKEDMPWALRTDPAMTIVPFGIGTLPQAGWIDHVILRPTEDIKNSTFYKGVSDIKGTHIETVRKLQYLSDMADKLGETIDLTELHEIRDARNGKIIVMYPGADGSAGRIIREEDDVLQTEGLPFITACFNGDPDLFYGPSDARILEPQQLELNECLTQAMYHRRIANLKIAYDNGRVSEDEITKLLSEWIMPAIGVDGDPNTAFLFLQPHVPPDLLAWVQHVLSASKSLLGMGGQDTTFPEAQSRSATDAKMKGMSHGVRMDEKRDAMADALQQIVRKWNQLIFKFWRGEKASKVIQVVGYDGAKYWVEYTADQIEGEYQLRVDPASMNPISKESKRKDLIGIIQALGSNPRANLDYLMKMMLREFDYIDAMKVFPEAPESAGGQKMGMEQFQQMQGRMLGNPDQLRQRAGRNAGQLQAAMGGGR